MVGFSNKTQFFNFLGEETPHMYEAALLVIGMLLSNFIFAVCFNTVGEIVGELNKDVKDFKK